MGIEDGNTVFTLKRELPYKLSGGSESAKIIELREPGMEHVKFYLRLRQMVMQAQMGMAKHSDVMEQAVEAIGENVKPIHEDVEKLEEEADAGHEFVSMSLLASDVDISSFISTFEKLACSHVRQSACMVDGKTPMTKALWETLHPDDAFDMAVRWITFFDTPSEGAKKTTSDQQLDSHTERQAV